ncbi:SUKH-4 family immunity protein [Kitasatospora sp. KL5]|uniref:SUKH-4 family immunity protein n=1 Tax=Kitasatospora sp. KL5 TaxID=3425125 RepID=UPI003D6F5F40
MAVQTEPTGRRPLTEAELPAGLTHGPSRRHLLRHGLPASGAGLDFTPTADGPLPAVAEGVHRLGSGSTCGEVVIVGATGEIRLADRLGQGLSSDPLASDLAALTALVDAVESGTRPDPAAYGGRRGPSVADAVVTAATARLRAIDPRLFADGGRPAHWETELLLRSLAWGARPGGPDGPAYEFEPGLVDDLADLAAYGEGGSVRRLRPEEVPAAITHAPTRRLLTEHGLPLQYEMFGVAGDGPLRTMAESHPEGFAVPHDRSDQAGFLAIGWWPHDLPVALDGATGRLELPAWYEEGGPARYLHRDLSALLYACWTYERLRAAWYRAEEDGHPWQAFDPRAVLHAVVDAVVEAVDPESFATADHSWRQLAEDPYTGGLLGG